MSLNVNTPESCVVTCSTFLEDKKNVPSCCSGFPIFRKQLAASCGALIGSVSIGMAMALKGYVMGDVPVVALPGTTSQTSTFMMSSWTSLDSLLKLLPNIVLSFGRLTGVFLCGWIMRMYGRKVAMLFSDMPLLVGWLSLTTTRDIWMSLFGCFSVGLGSGLFFISGRVYVLEICSPHYRGLVSTLLYLGLYTGILISDYAVFNLTWKYAFAAFVLVPICSMTLNLNVLESPHFSAFVDTREEAEKNFYQLRGRSSSSVQEMELTLGKAATNAIVRDGRNAMVNLFSAKFLRPLLVVSLLFVTLSSASMERLHDDADIDRKPIENTNLSILKENLPPVVVLCISCVAVSLIKRRHLFFTATLGIFIGQMLAILSSAAFEQIFSAVKGLTSFFGFTALPLLWLMAAEMIPSVIRDVGFSLMVIHVQFLSTIFSNAHTIMLKEFGTEKTFVIKACAIFVASVLLFFILPETKDVTLPDIEEGKIIHKKTDVRRLFSRAGTSTKLSFIPLEKFFHLLD